jgi:hypothetical protein
MTTIKSLRYALLSGIALSISVPSVSFAETEQNAASNMTGTHSLLQRVSHSLANPGEYTGETSGYKWGRESTNTDTASARWADTGNSRGSYKWGNSAPEPKSEAESYADRSSYQWGAMNFVDQSGYRWGMRSFADQSGYRWGMRSFADQSGYRWGMR